MFFKRKTIQERITTELIREMVSDALTSEKLRIENKHKKLREKEFELKRERLELNKMKSFGMISSVRLHDEIQKMESQYHKHKRMTKNTYDEDDIKAIEIKHTINFIKQCVE